MTVITGTHLSSSKGMLHIGKDAVSIGARTFQFFLRNPRGTRAKPLDAEDFASLRAFLAEHEFAPVVAHASYTLNPCSAQESVRELATQILAEDLDRMQHLPGNYYTMHPGSRGDQPLDHAITLIADALNKALRPKHETTILLETMSGKGTEVGGTFAELKAILDQVELQQKVGICLDSCHLFAAGYDVVDKLDAVLDELDDSIGLARVKAFHLNDSQTPLGSRKDRHATLGDGYLGLDTIRAIINNKRLKHLPFITETPLTLKERAAETALLRSLAN